MHSLLQNFRLLVHHFTTKMVGNIENVRHCYVYNIFLCSVSLYSYKMYILVWFYALNICLENTTETL